MGMKQKIMIVDDAEINRQILMAILGDKYEYVQAENGCQAVHMLQHDLTIDLILLDINMPEMNGFQMLERMNKFHWIDEIPVIMISSEEKRDIIITRADKNSWITLPMRDWNFVNFFF